MSSPDVVAAQALRLRRRMSWSQLALSFVAVLVMIGSLNALAEGLGVESRDELVGSLDGSVVVVGALVLYTLAAAALSWLLARGDPSGALKRFALVFTGGMLLIALAALVGSWHAPSGGDGGGSGSGSSRRRRSRRSGPRGLAMTICDPALAAAVFGSAPLEGPVSGDLALIRSSSSCLCTGDAGTVRLTVYPLERAGRSAGPTPLFSCAIVQDERWLVRVLARAGDGNAVDETALRALADDALARLNGVTGVTP